MDDGLTWRIVAGASCVASAALIHLFSGRWIGSFLRARRAQIARRAEKEGDVYDSEVYDLSFPGMTMGIVERSFFVLLTVVSLSFVGPAMIAWIVVKMVPNWEHLKATIPGKSRPHIESRAAHSLAYSALAGNMLGMTAALLAGLLLLAAIWCVRNGDLSQLVGLPIANATAQLVSAETESAIHNQGVTEPQGPTPQPLNGEPRLAWRFIAPSAATLAALAAVVALLFDGIQRRRENRRALYREFSTPGAAFRKKFWPPLRAAYEHWRQSDLVTGEGDEDAATRHVPPKILTNFIAATGHHPELPRRRGKPLYGWPERHKDDLTADQRSMLAFVTALYNEDTYRSILDPQRVINEEDRSGEKQARTPVHDTEWDDARGQLAGWWNDVARIYPPRWLKHMAREDCAELAILLWLDIPKEQRRKSMRAGKVGLANLARLAGPPTSITTE